MHASSKLPPILLDTGGCVSQSDCELPPIETLPWANTRKFSNRVDGGGGYPPPH